MKKESAVARLAAKLKEEQAKEGQSVVVPKAHGFVFVESVTRIELRMPLPPNVEYNGGDLLGTIRVWRDKDSLGPYELEDQDLHDEVAKFHPSFLREIATSLAKLPRVAAVEYTDARGNGGVIYVSWP